MIGITERAVEALLHLKASVEIHDPRFGLRLAPDTAGDLQLFVDSERAGDQIVEHGGSNLLLIGEDVFESLSGATLDCMPTPKGPQLILDRSESHNDYGDGNGNGNGNGASHDGWFRG